jgi:8-oxo-dGTP pyrophosphatase MutT (NUDIX family)
MVTSRSGRRWVFPKGRIEAHQTPAEAARAEAWEEGGLVGEIDGEAIGGYKYLKYGRNHSVTVFVLRFQRQLDEWPEKGQRSGEWVTVEAAVARVEEPGLRKLLRAAAVAGRLAEAVGA